MPYDLISLSTGLSLTFSRPFFIKALELGELNGWEPRMTKPPVGMDYCGTNAEWHGSYLTNDGQIVLDNDARWLAVALEKSLKNISDENPKFNWDPKLWTDVDLPEWLSPEEKELLEDAVQSELLDIKGVHPLEYFAGDEKKYLIRFVRFCRLGSFLIS